MLKDSRLRSGRRRSWHDTPNPMDGIANLVDVMLVFSCGLMIALLAYWKLDFGQISMIVNQEELVEVGDYQSAVEGGLISGDLDSKGVAYEDPKTGKIYVLMP